MGELLDATFGVTSVLAVSWLSSAQEIVSIFCSLAIAIVTCAVSVYRIWRDKDKDIKAQKPVETDGEEPDEETGNKENKEI